MDDEPPILYALRTSLEARGYKVASAETGEEGLALASAVPDVVVLDLGLPDLDGAEVIRRVRVERRAGDRASRSANGKRTKSMRSRPGPTTT